MHSCCSCSPLSPGRSLPQDLRYGHAGVLGVAPTWPLAAAALPSLGAPFDWQGDRPLGLPMEDLVIYEMHVRGFTWGGSAGVRAPGARPIEPAHVPGRKKWTCKVQW